MNSTPLVTIGITCFNAEDTILRAIDSALDQTYSNTEIIIVDDASIDNSIKVINSTIDQKNSIRLVQHEKNQGAPSAYNSIINNAKGKYICFFDDDDFSHKNRVEKTVQALEDNKENTLVCFCDRYVLQSVNKKIIKGLTKTQISSKNALEHMLDTLCYQYDRPYYRKNTQKFASLKKHNLAGSSAGTGIMTAPADILREYLFDPKMYRFCDTELNLRMFQNGISAINIDEPLMTQHVTSGTDKTSFIEKESVYHALTKHAEIYRSYGIYYPRIFSIDEEFPRSFNTLKMLDKLPIVTIALCTENSADTIFEVIKSALHQTYSNIEVIIIDNASSDATMDILSSMNDSRLIISRNKSKISKGECFNRILSQTKGDFIVFFSDKDIALKHRVESQINSLLEQTSKAPTINIADYYDHIGNFSNVHHCLGSYGNYVDSETLMSIVWYIVVRHSESKYLLDDYHVPFFEFTLFNELLCGKTEIIKKLGFNSSCADNFIGLDMLLRFSEIKGRVINTRDPLIQKYINPLRAEQWPEVVKESNAFIQLHKENFKIEFNTDPKMISDRNKLKVKLLNRMSKIKKYI